MRAWIEKLAKISKEKGYYLNNEIKTPNFTWVVLHFDMQLYLMSNEKSVFFKIYDDEYDMLKEVSDYIKNKTKDDLIKLIKESE